jgi:hypothetical protein
MHAAYAIFLFSLIVKDMLWLRLIMSAATVLVLAYAFQTHNNTILVWNTVFLVINVYHIVRIILQRRPIDLPPELDEIYRGSFSNMSKRDFLNFWRFGREIALEDGRVCQEGVQPDGLYYVTDGRAEVLRGDARLVTRDRLNFIAELSFFTGKPASADVRISGKAMTWTRDKLEDLKKINPDLVKALRESIAHGICEKLVAAPS